ncbi:MAG: RHS repeat-associated core domain-containing protein [Bacteroidales bacterium]|nr:RHS repeat-associated core domain-containing protein [Bacteroidales bacterium]
MTDADGNIAQHVEYIPYGEVFVEERNNSFSTNYLFNAKELDNETGLYYYGVRYLDPTGAMWLSVDPMWEKYAGMSPYNYCGGNPVKLVDPDGNDPLVVIAAGIGGAVNAGFAIYDNWDDPISLNKVGKVGSAFCGGVVCGAVAAGATFSTGTVVAISAESSAIGGFLGDGTEQGINIAAEMTL